MFKSINKPGAQTGLFMLLPSCGFFQFLRSFWADFDRMLQDSRRALARDSTSSTSNSIEGF
ncbi:MAG: hypothetical protein WBN40_12555, partial [Pseudomonadales bacterium]